MKEIKEKEIWKEIEGYEDYLVSTHGKIKSFKISKEGNMLTPSKTKFGHFKISLTRDGMSKPLLIHRLVAKTFIQNNDPENLIHINHKDENPSNNYVDNLEWCTAQYNIEYSLSKKYIIQYPDGHEETIFNLCKFCRENNLVQGNMTNTTTNCSTHRGFNILGVIDKNNNIARSKQRNKQKSKVILSDACMDYEFITKIDKNNNITKVKRKSYKIGFFDKHEEIIFNFSKFCLDNNLDISTMYKTLKKNNFHKGHKLLEIIQ